MKSLFSGSLLAAVITAGFASTAAHAQEQDQAYMIRTFELESPELIDISTSGGFIQVLGSDRSDVQVEMYVRQRNRYLDDADTSLDEFEIDVSQSGALITAHARRESGGGQFGRQNANISVSFIVRTPTGANVEARTSGGSMVAENLSGSLDLRTSGGPIRLAELDGRIEAHTAGGSIAIEGSGGTIVAHTSGGSLTASDSHGNLDLRTSGGDIRLRDIDGPVNARTSGGSIAARMLAVTDDIDLQTSGGNITLDLPSGGGYDIDLSGSSVRSELRNFSGEASRERLSGTVNGGGHQIAARTFGGSVRVNASQ